MNPKQDASEQQNPLALIDVKAVQRLTSIKRSTLYDWMREGRFPRPLVLSRKCSRWRLADVNAWLENPR
jgi:prophage regulatory protein